MLGRLSTLQKVSDSSKITLMVLLESNWTWHVFVNNELYCGKLLVFKKGAKFSMHYHLIKDETWYVDEGEFILIEIIVVYGIFC